MINEDMDYICAAGNGLLGQLYCAGKSGDVGEILRIRAKVGVAVDAGRDNRRYRDIPDVQQGGAAGYYDAFGDCGRFAGNAVGNGDAVFAVSVRSGGGRCEGGADFQLQYVDSSAAGYYGFTRGA